MKINITYRVLKNIGAENELEKTMEQIEKVLRKYKNNPNVVVNIEVEG